MSGTPPVRLVLLYGGQSAEHDVSRVSAAHVLRAIDTSRYEVEPVAITPDGRWLRSDATIAALAAGGDALPDALDAGGTDLVPQASVLPVRPGQQVVVLPILHGPRGEDGTVQGLLELAGVAYAGSGVLGSAANMDKVMSKAVATAAGLPMVRYLAVRDTDVDDAFVTRVGDELGWPVFVKPANMGSSVGVSKAGDPDALRAALAEATSFDEWAVVEEAVTAREIEVGVLGNESPRASVPGEIVPGGEFYDYDDKYVDGAAKMVIPADLPPEVFEEARTMAVQAFRALRCDGLARADFFYEADGRGLLFNEINTMPGFTPYSMFPSLWEATGLPYAELIDEIVALALARHAHRSPHRRLR
ncbi:MAG TPA: D-alanine--D-alanine ligase family protein [Aquihabitans sp.]|nr:D-alanine--D-alanine ligase family protein [Aquihabitans sp.]